MGLASSSKFEVPSDNHTATLYYFGGRGRADQIRWMMAATNVDFTQRVISSREKFLEMAGRQLPFGQLPLLQIDGMEIVQSQAAVRYLARRGGLQGTTVENALKCDMIAEAVRDVLPLVLAAPFHKYSKNGSGKNSDTVLTSGSKDPIVNVDDWNAHQKLAQEKWSFVGGRLEAILRANLPPDHPLIPKKKGEAPTAAVPAAGTAELYMVGTSLTYADILVAHITTWMVEEFGSSLVAYMPLLVALQCQVISLPGVKRFIRSVLYYPVGDVEYMEQVNVTLGRVV